MKALVSGQAGLAIVKDGDHFCMLTEETSPSLVRVSHADVRLFFGYLNDLKEFDAPSVKDLAEEIKDRQSSDRAIQLALILLDREEPLDVRDEAADCLKELFLIDGVANYVANRLYSVPMPDTGDLEGAIEICDLDSATREFFQKLLDDQQDILERWKAWEALSIRLFGSLEEKRAFQSVAIREGVFRMFVEDSEKGDWALYQMLTHSEFRGNPKARKVFQEWYEPFRTSYTPDRTAFSEESEGQSDLRFQSPVSAYEAFKNAEAQRDTIKKLLVEDRLHQALRYTDELILSQRRISQPEHLAKSLCDLAQFAKACGSPELQLTFALKATQEAPDDAWAFATLGDAYRGVTKYQEAIDAYQKSVVFGNQLTGHLGRAAVLKDLGQIDEALDLFEFCIREFPGNEIATNSRAAALAEFGRFDEALVAYDRILLDNPYNLITRSGRAQLLRIMGRLSEALEEFNILVHEYPHEVIPSRTRAEVIREMGSLEKAEFEMRSLIDSFPKESTFRIGRAQILRDLGQFDEAIAAFDEIIRVHPLNMAGHVGKADTFRRLGNFDLARSIYQEVIDRVDNDRQVRLGLASVYVAQSNYAAALALLPKRLPATKREWIAYHIRGMTFLRRGDFSKAQEILEWGAEKCPWGEQREYFITALATCRIREGRCREAVQFVEQVSAVSILPTSLAIGMHAYAELGDDQGFRRSHDAIPSTASPVVLRLRDSIVVRYKSKGNTQISSEQIFAAECDSLLIAA